MKHTTPDKLLTRELLCYVRDSTPTVEEFMARHGGVAGQCFHVLRKHEVIVVDDGRVRLNGRHLTPDGQRFWWGHMLIHLDRDEIWHVCTNLNPAISADRVD